MPSVMITDGAPHQWKRVGLPLSQTGPITHLVVMHLGLCCAEYADVSLTAAHSYLVKVVRN